MKSKQKPKTFKKIVKWREDKWDAVFETLTFSPIFIIAIGYMYMFGINYLLLLSFLIPIITIIWNINSYREVYWEEIKDEN